MRLSRIHIDQPLETGAVLRLDVDTSHYLGTVLRLRADTGLLVFNAQRGEFSARISAVTKQAVDIEIGEQLRKPHVPPLAIHLGLGISRGDRMDFAIQKSTELGVSDISPLYSQFSEVRLKPDRVTNKVRHWRKIAIGAAEQSGRLDLPVIDAPASLEEWNDSLTDYAKIMLDPSGADTLASINAPASSHIAVLIGPEGGFSEQELNWGRTHNFVIVNLGNRILRTETAPIAALAILQYRFGDL